MLDEQAARLQRGRIRRYFDSRIDPSERAHCHAVIHRVCQRLVRQPIPLPKEIDARHPLKSDRQPPTFALGVMRLGRFYQPRPRHNRPRLRQEARPPPVTRRRNSVRSWPSQMTLPRTWPRLGRWRAMHWPATPRSSAPWIRPPPRSAARYSDPQGRQISAGHPQATHAQRFRRHHVGRSAYRFSAICFGIPSMQWMGMQAKRPAAPGPLGQTTAQSMPTATPMKYGFPHPRLWTTLLIATRAETSDDKEQYSDLRIASTLKHPSQGMRRRVQTGTRTELAVC
ncbi:hypothetical protein SAMN05216345_12812 [Cupriavidus sp. YR651]|nr:hypothetical protein SAMN05216345_12812 [Cupriavidus sp. YR651]